MVPPPRSWEAALKEVHRRRIRIGIPSSPENSSRRIRSAIAIPNRSASSHRPGGYSSTTCHSSVFISTARSVGPQIQSDLTEDVHVQTHVDVHLRVRVQVPRPVGEIPTDSVPAGLENVLSGDLD